LTSVAKGFDDARRGLPSAIPIKSHFPAAAASINQEKRRGLVWEIDKNCRRTMRGRSSTARAATCIQPQLKGLTVMVNSQYNGWRKEDAWLDR
jgi:peptide/nickel transport system substrate-binding protein